MMCNDLSSPARKSVIALLAAAAAALLVPAAQGQALPAAHVEIFVDGEMIASFEQPPLVDDQGLLVFEGALPENGGAWEISWNFEVDPDPHGEGSIAGQSQFENLSGETHAFLMSFSIPVCPWIEHQSLMGGSTHLSLVTDDNGGQMSSVGANAVWSLTADGEGAHGMFHSPFLFGGSGEGNMSTSDLFGTPYPSAPGPAVEETFGLQLHFRLTDGERATFTNLIVLGADEEDMHECEPEMGSPDVNGDGRTNVLDLLRVLSAWGACDGCPEDITRDGLVDTFDLLQVLINWG